MAVDLLFKGAPLTGTPVNLVFGEDDAPPIVDAVVSLVASLPALSGSVPVAVGVTVGFSGAFPSLTGSVAVRYESDTQRPDVNEVAVPWQDAGRTQERTKGVWQDTTPVAPSWAVEWQPAAPLESAVHAAWQDVIRILNDARTHWQEAAQLQNALETRFQDAVRLRNERSSWFQEAAPLQNFRTSRFQDALRDRRNWVAGRFQEAQAYANGVGSVFCTATPFDLLTDGRYQEAMPPPPGIWIRPGPEPEEPCYLPLVPVHLLFKDAPGGPNLVFVCERHGPGPEPGATITVPVRRVYMLLNDATLTRVDGNLLIPTYNMSMSLDVDSWTWSFNASVPGLAFADLEPSGSGEPVEVDARINGEHFRFIVERISRDRSFANSRLRISGRGKSALLDSPYAPTMSFLNTGARTANQLMEDVLTLNGVPLPWTVEWEIEDWNVPAGAFSSNGSYMNALLQIANAPGAYIQPHPTLQTLYVKPRYPDLPWKWGDLTPDIELPDAGVTQEGIEWKNLPDYNRVFVSGTSQGVLGQVTLAGTDGASVAPMVTDPLITDVVAARQRGLSILSQTGRQAPVSLRMPIFEETGIIQPGKLVRYLENGVPRLGMSRSVAVEVGLPTIWQTVALETYE